MNEEQEKPEQLDLWAELDSMSALPPPPSGDKELAGLPDEKAVLHLDSAAIFDETGQQLLWILSQAVVRLGGAFVITKEERARAAVYNLGWDFKFERETGGIRIYAFPKQS